MLKLKYLINELVGATIWKLCVSEAEFNNAGDKVPYGYLVILFNSIVTQYKKLHSLQLKPQTSFYKTSDGAYFSRTIYFYSTFVND